MGLPLEPASTDERGRDRRQRQPRRAPDGDPLGGDQPPAQRDARAPRRRWPARRRPSRRWSTSCRPARSGVFLRGWRGDFDWTDEIGPERGYLLVNEMSDHLPIYVWGRNARGALELAGRGYGMGATMHADSLDEAIALLRDQLGATDAGPGRPDDLPPVLRLPHPGRHVPPGRGGLAPAPRRGRRAGARSAWRRSRAAAPRA